MRIKMGAIASKAILMKSQFDQIEKEGPDA